VMYQCDQCGKEVEKAHHCGQPTVHIRGWKWLDNDAVNFISSLVGAAVAWLLWRFWLG